MFVPALVSAAATAATTAAASAPIATAATLASGYAAYSGAVAGNKAAEYNAKKLEQESAMAAEQGLQAEAQQRAKTKQYVGAQRAGYGASGVDVNEGTPLEVQADTERIGELDALTIQANTSRRVNSLNLAASASRASKTNPFLAAGSTILTSMATRFVKLPKLGAGAGGVGDFNINSGVSSIA